MNDLDDGSRFNKLYHEYEHVLDDIVDLFEEFEKLSYDEFATYIIESVEDFTPAIKNLQICCLAYDYLLLKIQFLVRQDTGIDMLSMIDYGIWVSPNKMGANYVYYNNVITMIKNKILPTITSFELKKDLIHFLEIVNQGTLTSRME